MLSGKKGTTRPKMAVQTCRFSGFFMTISLIIIVNDELIDELTIFNIVGKKYCQSEK